MNIKIIIIIVFVFFHQSFYGQIEIEKIDTIVDNSGKTHKVLDNMFNPKSNYFDLVFKCKEKADSLLKKHFDTTFFNTKIILNIDNSYWKYTKPKFTSYFNDKLYNNLNKRPEEIVLKYSYIDNGLEFMIISITLKCYDTIEIINQIGIPKKTNYKINIDYLEASKIASKHKFEIEKYDKNLYVNQRLFLEYCKGKYKWKITKLIDVKNKFISKNEFHIYLLTRILLINVETGKIKKKRKKTYKGTQRFI